MIKLPDGDRAILIEEISEDLCPYCCKQYPSAEYNGYELWINLSNGNLYAKRKVSH